MFKFLDSVWMRSRAIGVKLYDQVWFTVVGPYRLPVFNILSVEFDS